MLRHAFLALLGTVSLSACAAEPAGTAGKPAAAKPAAATAGAAGATDALVRKALAKTLPGVPVDAVRAAPVPGFREVVLSGRVVYVSDDGKHVLQGTLIRLEDRANLTEMSEAVLRRRTLASVGPERRIVFPAKAQKHRVTVFTDIDCGYCRKLHTQMAEYNDAGITVEYLFFPRAGVNSESFDKAVAVWCAPDRNKALTDAKADRKVPARTCANPIAAEFELGQKIGVDGTPAVYLDDGTQIGGYLPPADMLQRLDDHAAQAREAAAAKPAVAAG